MTMVGRLRHRHTKGAENRYVGPTGAGRLLSVLLLFPDPEIEAAVTAAEATWAKGTA